MVIHMPRPKKVYPLGDLSDLMDETGHSLDEAMAMLPKASVSLRIPAIHAIALKVIAQETGLSLSEVGERLLCLGINDVLTKREVPQFQELAAVPLPPAKPDEDAA